MDNKFKYYLRKAKTLPPEMIIRKVCHKVVSEGLNTINKVSAITFGTKMSDVEFLRKAWNSNYQFNNLEDIQKHFQERKEPRFFGDSLKQEDIVPLIYKHFPSASDKIIAQADKICEHIFDLLGSGPVKLVARSSLLIDKTKELSTISCEPIDWHCDFKSGYNWNPKTYYKDIEIPYGKADIKIPWELSRFQHLIILGEAYSIAHRSSLIAHSKTQNFPVINHQLKAKGYSHEFVNQVNDWIETNPPEFGVNWTCTMDVAIRACNWLVAWGFFKDSPLISNEFTIKFFKSLLQHGRHIKNNLEYSETLTSNHYLSDIVGLVYLGVLIPEFKESEKWRNFGIDQLKKEMFKQVYPDGVDFEASTCYHRLVLELFFYAAFLVIVNDKNFKQDNFVEVGNEIFGEEYIQRLYKMFEFVLYALKPNGRMPQIGDNDSGRLHIFAKREVLDMRYLLTLGAIFFKEPKFKVKEFGFCEEALWIFGEKSYKIWQDLEENSLANIGSKAFPNAGWYMMRNDKNYCIISCDPNGQNGNGGHCHNDKLSFELCIDGKNVIVDPGTYIYTAEPKWRNKFRSTAYHNTVVVDGEEQTRFDEHSVFQMGNDVLPRCLKWGIGNEIDVFAGEHYGYKRFSQPVIHQREMKFHKKEGKLEVVDKFRGKGEHNLEWNLILSPEFRQEIRVSSDKLQWHKEHSFYSPEYGIITKTEKLTSTLRATMPAEVKLWIKI